MKGNFQQLFFKVRAILSLLGSQIETKRIFSIMSILTCFCHCRVGLKNLDLLVLLIKNWHDDPTIGFEAKSGPQDVDKFGKAKEEILDLLDAKFSNEVEDHVEDCVQNWDMYSRFW